MSDKKIWQDFFDSHAPDYMDNVFTKNTEYEVEFIVREMGLRKGDRVLDVGCGTGRHSIPLALQGMHMTGMDLSEGMLGQARALAERENASLELVQADAAQFSFRESFDHAICLCEGAMGLLGPEDDAVERDLQILNNISSSIKPGGKLLMTVLNGLKKIREHSPEDVRDGTFDPVHLVTRERMEISNDGKSRKFEVREKGFTAGELYYLLRQADMEILHLWGGTAGNWYKQRLDMDEYEIMVLARKRVP